MTSQTKEEISVPILEWAIAYLKSKWKKAWDIEMRVIPESKPPALEIIIKNMQRKEPKNSKESMGNKVLCVQKPTPSV